MSEIQDLGISQIVPNLLVPDTDTADILTQPQALEHHGSVDTDTNAPVGAFSTQASNNDSSAMDTQHAVIPHSDDMEHSPNFNDIDDGTSQPDDDLGVDSQPPCERT